MKLIRTFATILSAAAVLLSSCDSSDTGEDVTAFLHPHSPFTSATAVANVGEVSEEIRGVWIASVYNINFPSAPDLSEAQLKAEMDAIVQTLISHNMNTVYFQVHPASDSLYQSKLFPVSEYLYSDGVLHFDPLEYMADICRDNGIALYAWVNPLRVSVAAADSSEAAREALPDGSPGRNEKLTVFYGDGKLYFNCGVEAVRELVADTVDEIMTGYDIAGVVFDDYFYPYPVNDESGNPYEFADGYTYAASGTVLSPDDWRRDNVNQMVKLCYERVKSHGEDKQFGVAPFGIWQNDDGVNGGSATAGMEAYSALYCDAAAWIEGGYVDFISPQLYWETDSTSAPFGELARFWNDLTDGTGVELVISHGAYRYDNDWDTPAGELQAQVGLARELISYKGSVLYGYAALTANAEGLADDTRDVFSNAVYYYEPSSYPDGILLSPTVDAVIDDMRITFSGYSDPSKALTVNGKTITRGHGGYFECELELVYGENEFVFTNGDASKTVTVIKQESENKGSEKEQ